MASPNPLIIALDFNSPLKAINFVQKTKITGVAFKVGFELFLSGGPKVVEKIINHHVRVFLDLKFHDIPNTVARSSEVATKMGVWMFNVHASGGSDMMKRAKEASLNAATTLNIKTPLLLGVTVLTSMGALDEINIKEPVFNQVRHLALLAKMSGLDGVVASAQESAMIRQSCGENFSIVTPGIRLPENDIGDQKRVVTPREAMQNGSSHLVIGRPVTEAKNPIQVIDNILSSLK